jgi:hypothetical protein
MIPCWLRQRIVSMSFEGNAELPEWARRHLHRCPRCRETCEAAKAIARQLSVTASAQRRPASPFLHGKIMSAVHSVEHVEPRLGYSPLGWAIGLGAVCLVAASMLWLRQSPVPIRNASKSIAPAAEFALNVRLPSAAQVDQWTQTLDAPLEQETKLVLRDATAAIDTLARGFLPEYLLASSEQPAQR